MKRIAMERNEETRKIGKIQGEKEREERKKGKKEGGKITTGREGMQLRERRDRGRWEAQEKKKKM